MFTLIIASVVWISTTALFFFLSYPWWGALLLGLIPALLALFLISRNIMKKIQPIFIQAQNQIQSKQVKLGIKTLETALPYAKWQIMLEGQIYSQIGSFHYIDKNEKEALNYLEKGSPRAPEGQMVLASIYYRKKEFDKIPAIFDITIKVNKKQVLLYAAYAWMLKAQDKTEDAITVLQKGLKANEGNETLQDNLLRLQNNKKMNMKAYGMPWYTLQLEKPPMSMMQQQFAGRSGFRQQRKKGR